MASSSTSAVQFAESSISGDVATTKLEPKRIKPFAGLAFAFLVSPISYAPDIWAAERQRLDSGRSVVWVVGDRSRRISRREAMQIANEILQQAEHRRIVVIQSEAAQGQDWFA